MSENAEELFDLLERLGAEPYWYSGFHIDEIPECVAVRAGKKPMEFAANIIGKLQDAGQMFQLASIYEHGKIADWGPAGYVLYFPHFTREPQ